MKISGLTPILNVSDVVASLRWFESIGWKRSFTHNPGGMIDGAKDSDQHGPAGFAGLCSDSDDPEQGAMIFLCKDAQGSRDPRPCPDPNNDNYGGVWMSWWVKDVDGAHGECARSGIEIIRPPVNEPWGVREFLIRHPDGHYFRISGATQ